ncbi:MAG: hypothetical protein JKY96_07340 [Phycisphaerales bacterium]|nr:hypothetical protein [Phycisphaerales bacterium]
MNFKKLLVATSMLAVVATPAHAIKLNTAAGAGPVIQLAGGGTPSTGVATVVTPALELQNPSALLTGDYILVLETNVAAGLFPGSQNIDVTMTLPAGVTFAAALTSNDVTSLALTNATLQSGGALGSNTAQWRVSIPGAGSPDITFRVALATTTCPTAATGFPGAHPGVFTVAAAFSDGTPVEGTGPATIAAQSVFINTCAGFISGVVTTDETDEDTFVALPGFTTLADNDILVVGTNNAPSIVGSVAYTIAAAHRAVTVGGTAAVPTYTPVLATVGDVATISQTLTFADASSFGLAPGGGVPGVVGLDLADTGVAPAAAIPGVLTGNSAVITTANIAGLTTPAGAGLAHYFSVTPSATAGLFLAIPIASQPLSISTATVTFVDTFADFQPSEPGAVGPLDRLQRDGATFGPFDWNSEASAVNSIYRITGLPTGPGAGPVTYSVQLSHSKGGKNGFFTGTIPLAAILAGNGEVTVNSRNYFGLGLAGWDTFGLQAGMVGYDKADAVITIDVPNAGATVVDIDRLIASVGGIVGNYGDGSNSAVGQGTNADYDDLFPVE